MPKYESAPDAQEIEIENFKKEFLENLNLKKNYLDQAEMKSLLEKIPDFINDKDAFEKNKNIIQDFLHNIYTIDKANGIETVIKACNGDEESQARVAREATEKVNAMNDPHPVRIRGGFSDMKEPLKWGN